ncbi:MAG: SDR family NAD(P)-dependent oxidoreductase [Candidatus Magasanikbacteria bacterium]|nr:SDR family NAD(P)-dependent oxidoreductase [Candidatus Magasanikbacteria bacterium]
MKIFITGVSSGIGRAMAKQLVKAGHEVWGIARREELLLSLRDELHSPLFRFSSADVSDVGALKMVAEELANAQFMPEAVILNAGGYFDDVGGGTLDWNVYKNAFATNLDGTLFWVSTFLPDFLQRGRGLFIAVSSTAALRPSGSASYSASRAAISMVFRQLRLSFGERGVRFSTMHFGPVATRQWPGRRMFLVPPPEAAASCAVTLLQKRAGSYFFPFLTTTALRLSFFVPDRVFSWVARLLRPQD